MGLTAHSKKFQHGPGTIRAGFPSSPGFCAGGQSYLYGGHMSSSQYRSEYITIISIQGLHHGPDGPHVGSMSSGFS